MMSYLFEKILLQIANRFPTENKAMLEKIEEAIKRALVFSFQDSTINTTKHKNKNTILIKNPY